jgi:hypothetical protein
MLSNKNLPPSQTENVGSGVEEGRLGTPVPLGSRKHSRGDRVAKDTGQVVDDTTDDDGLGSKTTGACLCDNGVANLNCTRGNQRSVRRP